MTVETAHSGRVMGERGNQIWAPIRLVFAIGLLVPVGGGPAGCNGGGAGLNTGQLLVVTIAQWGSGLASNVWSGPNGFLQAMTQNITYGYAMPPIPPVQKQVQDALAMYACQYAYNWQIDDQNYPPTTGRGTVLMDTNPDAAKKHGIL